MLTGRIMQRTNAETMHQTNADSVFVRISIAFSRTLEYLSHSSSNAPTCIVTWQQVTLHCRLCGNSRGPLTETLHAHHMQAI